MGYCSVVILYIKDRLLHQTILQYGYIVVIIVINSVWTNVPNTWGHYIRESYSYHTIVWPTSITRNYNFIDMLGKAMWTQEPILNRVRLSLILEKQTRFLYISRTFDWGGLPHIRCFWSNLLHKPEWCNGYTQFHTLIKFTTHSRTYFIIVVFIGHTFNSIHCYEVSWLVMYSFAGKTCLLKCHLCIIRELLHVKHFDIFL